MVDGGDGIALALYGGINTKNQLLVIQLPAASAIFWISTDVKVSLRSEF